MKKQNAKILKLNKNSISNLNQNTIKGGLLSIYWCKTKRPCDDDGGGTVGNPGGPVGPGPGDGGDTTLIDNTGIASGCPIC
ncbi:hypothetical protein [uncultured Kordia sp.]|uniref:hypothetical protein n=1 Tax=uncultured Kordia sp. TaxID=507699 RepID=UPI002634B248|nr:hypothetical protein [uncultured Kordia sp.]